MMRVRMRLDAEQETREHDVLAERSEDAIELVVDGTEHEARVERADGELIVRIDGEQHRVRVTGQTRARIDGQRVGFHLESFEPGAGPGEEALVEPEGRVLPPMPGKIVDVSVAEGDVVTAGQVLATLEAMKMQTEIQAPRDGTVLKANVAPGDAVEDDQLIFAIGDEEEG